MLASDDGDEFHDRACLSLGCIRGRGNQDLLIERVAAANPRTVVVLETGGPVLMPWLSHVPAVLEAWYPGEAGGDALAALLFGDVNPGGRLPATFPRQQADMPAGTPAQYPGIGGRAAYSEGVFIGYRHYDEAGIRPLFPFGFGLSYTRFRLSDLRVRPMGQSYRLSVDVSNVGRRAGATVAEVYVGAPDRPAPVPLPAKQLRGFARVDLRARHSRRVGLTLGPRAFAYWDSAVHDWAIAPGCYPVMVGASAADIRLRARVSVGGARCGG